MADPVVKTDWQWGDIPLPDDFNRIEQNIWDVYQHNLTTATANYSLESATANYSLESDKLDGLHASSFLQKKWSRATETYPAELFQVAQRTYQINYDTDGNITSVNIYTDGTSTIMRTYQFTYDSTGKITQVKEAGYTSTTQTASATYTFSYDAYGHLTTITKEAEEL